MSKKPAEPSADRSEGDVNQSSLRRIWQQGQLDRNTRQVLDEDARWFLHQSLSTPCLNALQACAGIFLEDMQGRRYMDFHGNSVHQVGYGHPTVIQAIKDQLDRLPFCTRRYTNQVAIELAKRLAGIAPGNLNKVLFAPGGAAAIGMAIKLRLLPNSSQGRLVDVPLRAICRRFRGYLRHRVPLNPSAARPPSVARHCVAFITSRSDVPQ